MWVGKPAHNNITLVIGEVSFIYYRAIVGRQ